jgi:hypothetical protein
MDWQTVAQQRVAKCAAENKMDHHSDATQREDRYVCHEAAQPEVGYCHRLSNFVSAIMMPHTPRRLRQQYLGQTIEQPTGFTTPLITTRGLTANWVEYLAKCCQLSTNSRTILSVIKAT